MKFINKVIRFIDKICDNKFSKYFKELFENLKLLKTNWFLQGKRIPYVLIIF